MTWKFFFKRVWSYIFPVPGWRQRIFDYRDGKGVWEVTGYPEMDPMAPWPAEWCVWEVAPPDEKHSKHYPKMVGCVSHISGSRADGDDAVRCSRCGIPIHMGEAHMLTTIDIPACSWCVGSVRRTR